MPTDIRTKRRAEILSAAAREFAEMGFERAKIEEIARRAGIGKSTVYEYFPSKNELLTAVLTEEFQSMNCEFEAFFDKPIGLRDKLVAILDGDAGKLLLDKIGTLLNVRDTAPAMQFMRKFGRTERDFMLALLEKSVCRAIGTGEIRADIRPHLAAMFILALMMTASNQLIFGDVTEQVLAETVDYLFEGIGSRG
ncbi:MAG: TetR/AcrR family transcriptional regulator [Intestinibacillus sp.]